MPKFSVITPVNLSNQDRIDKFLRCIRSVKDQTFKDFEWVVINDGSFIDFDWEGSLFNSRIPAVNLTTKDHGERVIAYSRAFEVARGDWFAFLDSDDEYKPNYLERVNFFITKYPKYKLINFGCVYQHADGEFTFRGPFIAKAKSKGHEIFGGGNIVNGSFVFHRSVYEDLGGFPPDVIENIDTTEINYPPYKGAPKPYIRDLHMNTPYDFSAAAQLEFPEIRKYFMVDHEAEPEGKIIKELGNPWGQDFLLYYKYTRKYHSKAIKEYLYIVHPK